MLFHGCVFPVGLFHTPGTSSHRKWVRDDKCFYNYVLTSTRQTVTSEIVEGRLDNIHGYVVFIVVSQPLSM